MSSIHKLAKPSYRNLQNLVKKQAQQIEELNGLLQQVKNEIIDELKVARNLQESLMPKELPDFINTKIASIYIPAQKIGGDFYDIITTPTQKIAILIYDVSGHGMSSALIGAMAKMLFAHYIEISDSPAKIFHEINTKLCEYIKTEHYLTAFLGILDPIQNTLTYSRAGHVKPFIYRTLQKEVLTLDARGFFIGHSALADIVRYTEKTINLFPEDKFIFYTDGLTEGVNKNNELYGPERLMALLKKQGTLPIHDLLDAIVEDQNCFRDGTPLRDDFTILCLQVGETDYLLKDSGFVKEDKPDIFIIHKKADINQACSLVLKAMDIYGFPDKEIKRTKICIFEMITNGIIHGNKNLPEKKVILLYKITKEKASISVVDEGNGYDYTRLPDPLNKKNLFKSHGRGIYILSHLMDQMDFNEQGNRIMVTKKNRKARQNENNCIFD